MYEAYNAFLAYIYNNKLALKIKIKKFYKACICIIQVEHYFDTLLVSY